MEAALNPTAPLADAMSRIEAGQWDDALSLLRNLVRQNPQDGQLHALIGVCSAQQGKLDAAVTSLETAALLNPEDPAVESKLAWVLLQLGRVEQAKWRLARILQSNPDNADAQQLMAHIQATTAPAPQAAAAAPPSPARQATAPSIRQPMPVPTPMHTGAPSVGLRLVRGIGWGLLYCQTWTAFSLVGALLISLLTTRVEHAVIAFLVLSVLTTLFHSGMGLLTGVVIALLNADEDTGKWVGMSVGFLILLVGVLGGFLAIWSVVIYIFGGRWIGACVAARVQAPVSG